MTYLILGIILFCGVHLFPSAVSARLTLISILGENGYKGIFSLIAIGGVILMVVGYSNIEYTQIYIPPAWGRLATLVLMFVSIWLFAAANMSTNIKRLTRHPMLWGLVIWSFAHLLVNGDLASLILFAGLGCFGLLAMISANLRGAKKQIQKVPLVKEVMLIVAAVVGYGVLVVSHQYLSGVALIELG